VEEFGEDVALLVDGVTKVTTFELKGSKEEGFIENLRRMILVMAKDLRVVLVRLADRLHNMQTLDALSEKRQKRVSRETLEIYAPLAERLGIGEVKGQLEDLAFPYLYPDEYKRIKNEAKEPFKKAEEDIKKMKRSLLKKLAAEGIRAEIHGRKKHLYSLWRKLERPNIDWDFSEISDIVALRIIVSGVAQCYTTLGVVHNTFKPVPNIGVSDFIAQPKPNGYRSIHTKVFGSRGRIAEVQIRTRAMHEEAEYGIAAHWSYALAKSKGAKEEDLKKGIISKESRLSWVKQLVEWQNQMTDEDEFIKAVKFDALAHRNFIFSPGGDVYDLPKGATPVDFAYAVHTELGNKIGGAKVDGKMVPLDYELESGEVVEIVKSKKQKGPTPDWINFVKTETARREINKYLRKKGLKE
jgi:GTP pyrophosphokinase